MNFKKYVTFLVKMPTNDGAIIPVSEFIVLEIPNTIPENFPPISL